jgi:predicted ABC-type ATPase
LSPNHSESAAFQAGRFVLAEIYKAITESRTFCFESTLSGLSWQRILRNAKSKGFKVIIYFVFVNKISISAQRIKQRVKEGGHNIPLQILRRRTPKSFINFWKIYRPIADDWYVIDNSAEQSQVWLTRNQYEKLSKAKQQKVESFFFKKGLTAKASKNL